MLMHAHLQFYFYGIVIYSYPFQHEKVIKTLHFFSNATVVIYIYNPLGCLAALLNQKHSAQQIKNMEHKLNTCLNITYILTRNSLNTIHHMTSTLAMIPK